MLQRMENSAQSLADRIRKRLSATGLTARAASLETGRGPDVIRNIFKAADEGRAYHPRIDTIELLAKVLGTTPRWLTEGNGPEEVIPGSSLDAAAEVAQWGAGEITSLPLAGTVEAGAFRVPDDYLNQDESERAPVPPDPRYPRCRQRAWKVSGDSMNQAGIVEGMWIVAADFIDFVDHHGDPTSGDFLVIERSRYGGQEREYTVKEARFYPDRMELLPRSTNPAHQKITVKYNHEADPDGEQVTIVGVVLGTYNAFRRPGS